MYILNDMECDIKIEELEKKILALEAKEKYRQYYYCMEWTWYQAYMLAADICPFSHLCKSMEVATSV